MPQITPKDHSNTISAVTKSVAALGRTDTSKMDSTTQDAAAVAAPVVATDENVAAASTEESVPAVSADDPNAAKFLELAKRTKAQRALELKLKQEQQSLEAKRAEIEKKQAEYENNYIPKDRLKNDLIGVLTELGYDPSGVVNAIQSGPVSMEMTIRQLQQKIAQLEAGTSTVAKNLEENTTAQYQAAVNNIRTQAKSLVAKDPSFETIKAMGKEEDIVKRIEKVFNEGEFDEEGNEIYAKGTVLDVTEVAQKIEETLLADALRIAQLNKVKQKLAPVVEETAEGTKQKTATNPKQTQIKTLTNTMTASPSKSLSAAERRARAIAIAEGRIPN